MDEDLINFLVEAEPEEPRNVIAESMCRLCAQLTYWTDNALLGTLCLSSRRICQVLTPIVLWSVGRGCSLKAVQNRPNHDTHHTGTADGTPPCGQKLVPRHAHVVLRLVSVSDAGRRNKL